MDIKEIDAPSIKRPPGRPIDKKGKRRQVGFSCTPEAEEVLSRQDNKSQFICDAIIEKAIRDEV